MLQILRFLGQYVRHPITVGAIAPSGKGLTQKMMEPIDFENAACIVEYGPGTGAFTAELYARKRPETRLILIEQNLNFYSTISKKYRGKKYVNIFHGSAEYVEDFLSHFGLEHADYVVSGLPFTSLPKTVSDQILAATTRILGTEGRFITFQYSRVKEKLFRKYFDIEEALYTKKNIPPAYVYICKNKVDGSVVQ